MGLFGDFVKKEVNNLGSKCDEIAKNMSDSDLQRKLDNIDNEKPMVRDAVLKEARKRGMI